jgi:hypothetical protein
MASIYDQIIVAKPFLINHEADADYLLKTPTAVVRELGYPSTKRLSRWVRFMNRRTSYPEISSQGTAGQVHTPV